MLGGGDLRVAPSRQDRRPQPAGEYAAATGHGGGERAVNRADDCGIDGSESAKQFFGVRDFGGHCRHGDKSSRDDIGEPGDYGDRGFEPGDIEVADEIDAADAKA
jgi:hypothetical protein